MLGAARLGLAVLVWFRRVWLGWAGHVQAVAVRPVAVSYGMVGHGGLGGHGEARRGKIG